MNFSDRFWIGALSGLVVGAAAATFVTVYMIRAPRAEATVAADSGLVIPTAEEADAAFKRAKSDTWSLTLGECNANQEGPGVTCAVDFKQRPDMPTRQGIVVFARTPSGWMATHLY